MGRKKFNDQPFAYHAELELEISTLTNLGSGLGRVKLVPADGPALHSAAEQGEGWVVMVPFTVPGERVRARVFRNHRNFSEADLVEVLAPAPDRVAPRCALFGRCGGCQYQHLSYAAQLAWKRRQVAELLRHLAGLTEVTVAPVVGSPREYHYRSKITPHFAAPRPVAAPAGTGPARAARLPDGPGPAGFARAPKISAVPATDMPIGFLRQGTRFEIVDVPCCPIATEAINQRLTAVRARVLAQPSAHPRGATLLLRDAGGEVTTDYDAVITESIGDTRLRFLARDFFQNNPCILPAFTRHVREQAAAGGARHLVDAYCGSGLFALTAASAFERVVGIELSESSIRFARDNAAANGVTNASFHAGDASAIFASLRALVPAFAPAETAVIIDPPRKGCNESFLAQLLAFAPRTVVYVSCDPATQMRDLKAFLAAGYCVSTVQPFDLFPQTRHLECVLTLRNPVSCA